MLSGHFAALVFSELSVSARMANALWAWFCVCRRVRDDTGWSITAGGAGRAVLRAAALVVGGTSVHSAGARVGWLVGPGVVGARVGLVGLVRCGVVGCVVGSTLGGGAWG